MNVLKILDEFLKKIPSDITLDPKEMVVDGKEAHRLTICFVIIFIWVGLCCIWFECIDNLSSVSSTNLILIHKNIVPDFYNFLGRDFWVGRHTMTPSPFYDFVLALVFKVFGYNTKIAMSISCLLGGMAGYILFHITRVRFGDMPALIATVCYFTGPTVITYSYTAGYYIWGTFFLLLSFWMMDRYSLTRKKRYYYFTSIIILLGSMCRPELVFVALPMSIVIWQSYRSRLIFIFLSWLYPIARIIYKVLFLGEIEKIDVLSQIDSFGQVFNYFLNICHILIGHFPFPIFLGIAIFFLLWKGFRKTPLLAYTFLSYILFFLLLYKLGRFTIFSTPYYYLGHYVLLLPFAGQGLYWTMSQLITIFDKSKNLSMRQHKLKYLSFGLVCFIILFSLLKPDFRALFNRKWNAGYQEAKYFLKNKISPSESIVFDTSEEMLWLRAELETDKSDRTLWCYYNIPLTTRPVVPFNQIDAYNVKKYHKWLSKGFKDFVLENRPNYFVFLTQEELRRKTKSYKIYTSLSYLVGLRLALDFKNNRIPLNEDLSLILYKILENDTVEIYRGYYKQEK